MREALAGRDSLSLLPQPTGILQVVTVPVTAVTRDRPHPEMLGTLSAGFLLDDTLAVKLKQITGSDIAFGMDGQILAATLPREQFPALAERLRVSGISRVQIDGESAKRCRARCRPPPTAARWRPARSRPARWR